MSEEKFKKILGARILNEANDLKRTADAMALEMGVHKDTLKRVMEGVGATSEINEVIEKMATTYPIDKSDLFLVADDCIHGVKIMRAAESKASSRVFQRKNSSGTRTPYYEYRDTVTARISPFRPEWIKELRHVKDNNPHNTDVVYNNGHALHQTTFFIGPVNFYWEVHGKKFCEEMSTGDSNYITPYWPHSFTSRDKNKDAFILAVTFSGNVKRALKELSVLGERGINGYTLDYQNNKKAIIQLVKQHMANENMTAETLGKRLKTLSGNINVQMFLRGDFPLSKDDLNFLAAALNVQLCDIIMPEYASEKEVVVKHYSKSDTYYYPSENEKMYLLSPLARTSKMPLMKGFGITVLGGAGRRTCFLSSSLHLWIYNYGKVPVKLTWAGKDEEFSDVLRPNDSVYIQPFVRYSFSNTETEQEAQLCSIGVGGAIGLETQKELSCFSRTDRIIENEQWFS